jgi:uncharacterized protein DUF6968
MIAATGKIEIICVRPNGERLPVTVAVGHPYPTIEGDWACPVAMTGLHGRLTDVHGTDSLQALCLGIKLVGNLLASFVAEGGRILDPKTGEGVELDTYFNAGRPLRMGKARIISA